MPNTVPSSPTSVKPSSNAPARSSFLAISEASTPTPTTDPASTSQGAPAPASFLSISAPAAPAPASFLSVSTPRTAIETDGAPAPNAFLHTAPKKFIGESGESIHSITPRDYMLGAFVPTILAVVFSIPWHILASALKKMEPFYQLQHVNGAKAEDSLLLDYRACNNVIATFKALRRGHFLVWWSGLVSILVLFLPPFASEAVFIGFTSDGNCSKSTGREDCVPLLSVYPVAARLVQGILSAIAVLTFALGLSLWRKCSGVFADPSSIAGVATVFQDPDLIDDFRSVHKPAPSIRDLKAALSGHRYRMGTSVGKEGSLNYGIVKGASTQPVEPAHRRTSSFSGKEYTSVALNEVDEGAILSEGTRQKTPSTSLGLHPAIITVFIVFVSGLAVLVIYYNKVGTKTGFERFMSSESFGASFLFTAFGVTLKTYWTFLDDNLRGNEPYRLLSTGPRPATSSILLEPPSNPFAGFIYALRHSQWFNAYVSLVAMLCIPLIISLANIPFKPGTAYVAFTAATWIVEIPGCKSTGTLAGVLALLCGSHVLGDFRGIAELRKEDRNRTIRAWGKNYALGFLVGEDGVERENIDEVGFVTRRGPSRGKKDEG